MDGLVHLLIDSGIIGGSLIADKISTYFAAKKFGAQYESNISIREGMQREGVGKYLLKNSLDFSMTGFPGVAGAVGTFYGLDFLLGLEDIWNNFHHYAGYGLATIKYLAAIGNTTAVFGFMEVNYAVQMAFVPLYHIFNKLRIFGKYDV